MKKELNSKPLAKNESVSKGLIAWFACNPVAANLLLLLIITLGLMQLGQLRKETFPSIEPNRVTISINYDSGSAKQAEEGLALKIEEALENVTGIKKITSESNKMGTTVTLIKESSTDLDVLFDEVKRKVDAIYNFPTGAENPVIDKQRMQDHALQIAIYGNTDRRTLQLLQDELKQDLLRQDAIHEIITSGEREPLISIELDESKLQAYGLSFSGIATILNNESLNAVAGEIRGKNRTLTMQAASQAYRFSDFATIPLITNSTGSQVLLGDVAVIHDDFADDTSSITRFQGKPAMSLQLVMDEHSDISNVVTQAKEIVNEWQNSGRLPSNVQISTWYDKSGFITDRLKLMTSNAMQGIFLVAILLAVFLNLRVAFWVAAGLPFCFIGTFYFMGDSFLGLSINELTTFGFIMALGIVVDDAVVVGESIYTTKERDGDTLENTIKGTKRVAIPTMFGVLTTVAAFLPITQIDGMLGKIFSQFSFVVVVCLLLSLVESKLILPAHLAHVNTKHEAANNPISRLWRHIQITADNSLIGFNKYIYQPLLSSALQYRYAVILGFISLLILSAGLLTTGKVRTVFFPDISGEVITASFSTVDDAGFGLTEMHVMTLEKTLAQADQQLQREHKLKHSVIQSVMTTIGDDNSGSVQVELNKESNISISQMENTWRSLTPKMEAVKKLEFNTRWGGVDGLRIELLANDAEQLELAGKILRSHLENIQGVKDLDDNLSAQQPHIRLTLTAEGRAQGFSSSELAKQILQNFGGEKVQQYQRNYDEIEVKVRYPSSNRQTLSDLQQSRIRNKNGEVVPLSNVARIELGYEKKNISRLNKQSSAFISASVDKTIISPNEIIAQLKETILPEIERSFQSVTINFAGEAEEQAETTNSMIRVFMIALMAIYMLLAVPLRSYIQPLLIMTVIPFGVVGAIWGHLISALPVSLLSIMGIIALSGVVVNDSLLLVSYFNDAKREGLNTDNAIMQACANRLRAIFLTSITTFAGLIPILSETSTQSQFLKPAAASMAYGILFATAITLILIPLLLKVVDDAHCWINAEEINSNK